MKSLFGLLGFESLMKQTEGDKQIRIGVIDGPIDFSNPHFCKDNIDVPGESCEASESFACAHGTFIAGLLKAKREEPAWGICPGCTLISKPVFKESKQHGGGPVSTEQQIYESIVDCIRSGARIINMSLSQNILSPSSKAVILNEALDLASRSNVLIIAAAGNDSMIGKTMITKHPWTIPVSACNRSGLPINLSNYSLSGAANGVMAPGHNVKSLAGGNNFRTMNGTSAAVPFVTGAAALLWSEFKHLEAAHIRYALVKKSVRPQRSIIPGLLNVHESLNYLKSI